MSRLTKRSKPAFKRPTFCRHPVKRKPSPPTLRLFSVLPCGFDHGGDEGLTRVLKKLCAQTRHFLVEPHPSATATQRRAYANQGQPDVVSSDRPSCVPLKTKSTKYLSSPSARPARRDRHGQDKVESFRAFVREDIEVTTQVRSDRPMYV
jgi:hypothetical protein